MEIIIDGWPSDGKEQVLLDEITCKYIQEADCTESRDEVQEIIFSSRDGGGGKFINFSTKSWSITGEDFEKELVPLFEDFKTRMNYVKNSSDSGHSLPKFLENDDIG